MAQHWQLRQRGTQCQQHGHVEDTDTDLPQLGLEASEAALPCDVLKVQGIQLGPGQQVLALEQSYDGMVWQLSRLIHKRIFLAIHCHQGMARNASSASVRPASAKQQVSSSSKGLWLKQMQTAVQFMHGSMRETRTENKTLPTGLYDQLIF